MPRRIQRMVQRAFAAGYGTRHSMFDDLPNRVILKEPARRRLAHTLQLSKFLVGIIVAFDLLCDGLPTAHFAAGRVKGVSRIAVQNPALGQRQRHLVAKRRRVLFGQ